MEGTETNVRPVIGLEIHVQLLTESKLFCACPVRFDAPPNSCVCPVCLGQPGALPVLNQRALELALQMGVALNGHLTKTMRWDRKSYYYPDLPKNYQISQYDHPIATNGYFEVPIDKTDRRIRIGRVHLEEDAGKSLHDASGGSRIDLNRAGTPLLEIVTEPDLSGAEETYNFCIELHRLVTYLGVSEGNLKKGQMRFEPNVNLIITQNGQEYRTPIAEIKNLNSFRAVREAVAYEQERQWQAWNDDPEYLFGKTPNENRGWDAERGVTEFQRGKETADDYRYFPDPDLVPVRVEQDRRIDLRNRLTELPLTRLRRLSTTYGLSPKDAETIVADRATADLFEEAIKLGAPPPVLAKQFVNIWQTLAHEHGCTIAKLGPSAGQMAELAGITADGAVNKSAVNRIAEALLSQDSPSDQPPRASRIHSTVSPLALAKSMGLIQVRDEDATHRWVDQVLEANEKAVKDALANPKKSKAAVGFLRGQVMKLSGGKADPRLVGECLEERLREMTGD